jgi:predicted  nucleic acid-binding Zn-ribbon protein
MVVVVGEAAESTEVARLRTQLHDLRATLTSLKEDNARKARLLQTLKEAKQSDTHALEKWKLECEQLTDTNKRLTRAIASKEALNKDLRAKVELVEEQMKSAGLSIQGSGDADAHTHTPARSSHSPSRERAHTHTVIVPSVGSAGSSGGAQPQTPSDLSGLTQSELKNR